MVNERYFFLVVIDVAQNRINQDYNGTIYIFSGC